MRSLRSGRLRAIPLRAISLRAISLLAIAVLACLARSAPAMDVPAPGADDRDAAWKTRIADALQRVESAIDALDLQKTSPAAELVDRVQAAHERLKALEEAAALPVGAVRAKPTAADLTADVGVLSTRARAVADARRPKPKDTPPPGPPPPPVGPAKPKEEVPADDRRGWPVALQFNATAKVVYRETGDWLYPDPRLGPPGCDFLMNGYSGIVSFSLSSNGLKQEVQAAELRVVVTPRPPFGAEGPGAWVYDVTWTSEVSRTGTFGNGSLKHFTRHAQVYAKGPGQWIVRPKDVSVSLPVKAHVLSVRLKSGEEISFTAPAAPTR